MTEYTLIMLLGGGFLLLGIVLVLLDRGEKNAYYDAMAQRRDVREFIAHDPERPELGALKIGGVISVVLGLILLALGGGIWLWG